MKWKTIARQFLLISLLLSSLALALFSFTTPRAQAATNLAPMPGGWKLENEHPGAPQFIFVDYSVTHNGNPSLRVERDVYHERDGFTKEPNDWIPIKPGDQIVFQCWMKTNAGDGQYEPAGYYYSGARLGIDFYDNYGRLGATQSADGHVDGEGETSAERSANFVYWNTPTWTQRKIEFNVPSTVGGKRPTGMIPWFMVMPAYNTGLAWFADCELYVNPTSTPPTPPTPTPETFSDGFESGNLAAWTNTFSSGGTATVQSSIKHDGAYALDASLPATAGAYVATVRTLASPYSTLFVNAYVRFSALPTSGNYLMLNPTICDSGNSDLVAVYVFNNAGTYQWALMYKTNAVARNWVYSSTPTPTINTWYNLEVKFLGGVGTGEARLWVNGVERCTKTGLTNNNPLAQQVQVGASTYASGARAVHVYTDSVIADDQYIGADLAAPTYSDLAHDTTVAATSCKLSSKWQDDTALSKYIFSWNGTGSWTNNTAVAFSGNPSWANITKTLPSVGTVVSYRWYASDTSGSWATTIIYSFTTTAMGQNTVVLLNVPADDAVISAGTQSFTYTPIFSQAIQNASLWLNLTGTWQPVQWSAAIVANNTVNSFSLSLAEPSVCIWNIAVYSSTTYVFARANRTLTIVLNARVPVLTDGFESGTLSAWTTTLGSAGSTATVQSSMKYSGTYALDSSLPATAGAYATVTKTFASSYSTLFARAYVRFSVRPTFGNRLQLGPTICDANNGYLVAVYIRNIFGTYQWALYYKTNTGSGWVYSSTPTPTINTWYCLEIKFVGGVGTGEARLWVNGVERCTKTGLTNNNALAQQVQVGVYSPSALAVHVFTDSVITDIQYIGTESARPIQPS